MRGETLLLNTSFFDKYNVEPTAGFRYLAKRFKETFQKLVM